MKIGFLLNHSNAHQVPHVVPFAFALSKLRTDFEVTIFSSSDQEQTFARKIGTAYPGHKVKFEHLHIPLWARLAHPLTKSFLFVKKHAALKANAELLAKLDALVTPEMTSLALRDLADFSRTKLIFTGHGAGDNRQGGSFNPRIGHFDLALMPGRNYAQGLQDMGYLRDDRYGLSGYAKLEAMQLVGGKRQQFFKNNNPTVLYSPHHNNIITSWHKQGCAILDFFYAQSEYNLVFAPHVLLFQRALSKGARLPKHYQSTDHILIDTDSERSIDMTYLKSADIFLGDVTSQFYEFLETPRPAVFMDAHNTNWQNDPSYGHWHLGEVIRSAIDLKAAIEKAQSGHSALVTKQVNAFKATFENAGELPSHRGARVIADFLTTGLVNDADKL